VRTTYSEEMEIPASETVCIEAPRPLLSTVLSVKLTITWLSCVTARQLLIRCSFGNSGCMCTLDYNP